jgi:hypothetical protein
VASPPEQPGWRPDPEHAGMVRWWNGLGWSDARRSADGSIDRVRAAAQDALRASTITPQQVADTQRSRRTLREAPAAAAGRAIGAANPFAAGAITVGVLGFIVGLFGVLPLVGLILSLAGLLRSRRLAREGATRTGFGQSLAGLVLSVIGLLRWVPVVLQLVPVQDLLNR